MILVKDFLFLYALKTHQSVRIHTPIRGEEHSPLPTRSSARTVRAFQNKEVVPSPSTANIPVIHGVILLQQLRTDIEITAFDRICPGG